MDKVFKSRAKGNAKKAFVIAGAVVTLAAVGTGVFFLRANSLRNSSLGTVNLECGKEITLDIFFDKVPSDASFITDISQIDVTKEGSYKISINNSGYVTRSVLNISDTTAPAADAVRQETYLYQLPDPHDCVANIVDVHDVTVDFEDAAEEKVSTPGSKMINVILTDTCGNSGSVEVPFDVIDDCTAPWINGVSDYEFEIDEFEEFDFLDGITTGDDYDKEPLLLVDDSQVDFSMAGMYEIVYSSTDEAGNCREIVAIVSIIEHRETEVATPASTDDGTQNTDAYRKDLTGGTRTTRTTTKPVSGSTRSKPTAAASTTAAPVDTDEPAAVLDTSSTAKKAYDAARKVYNSIITSGMSKEQKAFKIVWWVHKNIKYSSATMDETSWAKACIQALKTKKANCYGFYATCKAMFDLAGISSKQVQRNSDHKHYWNVVYLNGGWYHCDATPFSAAKGKNPNYVFMMTNSEIRSLSFGNYIFKDPSPAVSTLSVQSCLNYSNGTITKTLPSPAKPTAAATTAAPASATAAAASASAPASASASASAAATSSAPTEVAVTTTSASPTGAAPTSAADLTSTPAPKTEEPPVVEIDNGGE